MGWTYVCRYDRPSPTPITAIPASDPLLRWRDCHKSTHLACGWILLGQAYVGLLRNVLRPRESADARPLTTVGAKSPFHSPTRLAIHNKRNGCFRKTDGPSKPEESNSALRNLASAAMSIPEGFLTSGSLQPFSTAFHKKIPAFCDEQPLLRIQESPS
jgi:hypothetical protein